MTIAGADAKGYTKQKSAATPARSEGSSIGANSPMSPATRRSSSPSIMRTISAKKWAQSLSLALASFGFLNLRQALRSLGTAAAFSAAAMDNPTAVATGGGKAFPICR